jgi:hypothetical protein
METLCLFNSTSISTCGNNRFGGKRQLWLTLSDLDFLGTIFKKAFLLKLFRKLVYGVIIVATSLFSSVFRINQPTKSTASKARLLDCTVKV